MQMNFGPSDNFERHVIITQSATHLRAKARETLKGHWKQAAIASFLAILITGFVPEAIDLLFGKVQTIDLSKLTGMSMSYPAEDLVHEQYSSPLSSVYVILIMPPITFGCVSFFLHLRRTKTHMISDIFSGFELFAKTIGLLLWQALFAILWFLVPLVGPVLSVIALIRYSQSFYILFDQPETPITDCVRQSKALMFGNKMKYFTLNLSFIGWFILSIIPVSIAVTVAGWLYVSVIGGDISGRGGLLIMYLFGLIGSFGCAAFVYAYTETARAIFYDMLKGNIKENEVFGEW